jgi:exopolyphosphatase/guanosine-5'-triphosphate,3'-diphosphate pyrophosphatase
MVRLAAGVAENGRIDKDVAARALACLERFGQRLRDMHADSVRVVGTNALRRSRTRNRRSSSARARRSGIPIEIIAGMEEARLIYAGVAHTMPNEPGRRLVVDVGGGSTELIIGEGLKPLELESLQMGCVSLSERFFRDGKPLRQALRARASRRAAGARAGAGGVPRRGWDTSFGSSGTVRAIGEVIRELDPAAQAITAAGIERAIKYCVDAGHTRELAGADHRGPPPGVSRWGLRSWPRSSACSTSRSCASPKGRCARACCTTWSAAITREDARERTVRSMQRRYHVDCRRPSEWRRRHCNFLSSTRDTWRLGIRSHTWRSSGRRACTRSGWMSPQRLSPPRRLSARERRHAGLRARGAAAARAPGRLAPPQAGSRGARGPGPTVGPARSAPDRAAAAGGAAASGTQRRGAAEHRIGCARRTLELRFPARWLKEHPLTVADLQLEIEFLRPHGIRLRVFSGNRAG